MGNVFDQPEDPPRPVNPEELLAMTTALVHQLGGEATIDRYEIHQALFEKNIQIFFQQDPYMILLKEVDKT